MSEGSEKRFLANAEPRREATELAKSLYKSPTLLTTWTRCGKPRFGCTEGQLHGPYHVLYWRDGLIQRRRYVRAADVPAVRAILAHRRAQRRADQQALADALHLWRALDRLVKEYEARLPDDQERP